jgi:hypothetical protein
MKTSGIEPATIRPVELCLNQLRYLVRSFETQVNFHSTTPYHLRKEYSSQLLLWDRQISLWQRYVLASGMNYCLNFP